MPNSNINIENSLSKDDLIAQNQSKSPPSSSSSSAQSTPLSSASKKKARFSEALIFDPLTSPTRGIYSPIRSPVKFSSSSSSQQNNSINSIPATSDQLQSVSNTTSSSEISSIQNENQSLSVSNPNPILSNNIQLNPPTSPLKIQPDPADTPPRSILKPSSSSSTPSSSHSSRSLFFNNNNNNINNNIFSSPSTSKTSKFSSSSNTTNSTSLPYSVPHDLITFLNTTLPPPPPLTSTSKQTTSSSSQISSASPSKKGSTSSSTDTLIYPLIQNALSVLKDIYASTFDLNDQPSIDNLFIAACACLKYFNHYPHHNTTTTIPQTSTTSTTSPPKTPSTIPELGKENNKPSDNNTTVNDDDINSNASIDSPDDTKLKIQLYGAVYILFKHKTPPLSLQVLRDFGPSFLLSAYDDLTKASAVFSDFGSKFPAFKQLKYSWTSPKKNNPNTSSTESENNNSNNNNKANSEDLPDLDPSSSPSSVTTKTTLISKLIALIVKSVDLILSSKSSKSRGGVSLTETSILSEDFKKQLSEIAPKFYIHALHVLSEHNLPKVCYSF